jgi:uncharacterized phage protein gp47/JayE
VEFLTRLDLYEIGRTNMRTQAKRIDASTVDVAGSDANLFVGATSFMTFAVQRQLIERINALYLDGCNGEDLDRWAFDRYRILRKGASPARTSMVFSRAVLGGGAGQIDAGRKFVTPEGIEYLTTQPTIFQATTMSVSTFVRAVNAGKDYQIGANNLRKPSSGTLFDPRITMNNPTAAAGGENRESNDVFRERIRDFWRAMSRGTIGAIEYGARTVPGVESAQAIEETDNGKPARLVQLSIADSSGVSSLALETSVEVALDDWSGAGVYVNLVGGYPQMIPMIQLNLKIRAGYDYVTLQQNIQAAVVEYSNSLGIGKALYRGALMSVLARFQTEGLELNDQTILQPLADIIPARARTLRIRPEAVSFTLQ